MTTQNKKTLNASQSPYTIIATVIEAGTCCYYREGTSFELNGFTPKGICDSAYAALSRDAYAMRYGADIPWQSAEDRLHTHCPDPTGAIWEIRRVKRSDKAKPKNASDADDPDSSALWELTVCRSRAGGCRHACMETDGLADAVRACLRDSGLTEYLRRSIDGPIMAHHRFRVAIAGCPNSCSQPQIKDIGIVAQAIPRRVLGPDRCMRCSLCVDTCREHAIDLGDTGPEIDRQRCVNCGVCTRVCPTRSLALRQRGWKILVGGRLGRHPRLAMELLAVGSDQDVVEALQVCLQQFMKHGSPGQRFADFVTQVGLDRLKRRRPPVDNRE